MLLNTISYDRNILICLYTMLERMSIKSLSTERLWPQYALYSDHVYSDMLTSAYHHCLLIRHNTPWEADVITESLLMKQYEITFNYTLYEIYVLCWHVYSNVYRPDILQSQMYLVDNYH